MNVSAQKITKQKLFVCCAVPSWNFFRVARCKGNWNNGLLGRPRKCPGTQILWTTGRQKEMTAHRHKIVLLRFAASDTNHIQKLCSKKQKIARDFRIIFDGDVGDFPQAKREVSRSGKLCVWCCFPVNWGERCIAHPCRASTHDWVLVHPVSLLQACKIHYQHCVKGKLFHIATVALFHLRKKFDKRYH